MVLYSVYIINKAGSLIYNYDHVTPRTEVEKTFSYPLEMVLREDERLTVAYGERDGIKIGYSVIAVNGENVSGRKMLDGTPIIAYLQNADNFPLNIRFGKPKLSVNEKITLASTFHSMYAIACKLSPVSNSSGIEVLETGTFRLWCYQTLTGIKFVVITDQHQSSVQPLLRKIYEIYTDYALKNPFYSLDMPIRLELFDLNLQRTLEAAEKNQQYNANIPTNTI
ncbi:Trafficking protein particle complex subunit 4 [Trichoplax sp. H2]|uniref:Trafficking protein particle complex subunit n=1 Tax=Trichoplax adhaerens TaxID=10228 RepID=B3SCU5_TRIAD|nr:hypothetical protein TRIADDRAFT_62101 [Trichoplax adhaerens]EDV19449.1 hypothetical protein TRIADDRAFT_62101 [Trichoplax adhaerens]RDD41378.1 Trafficking protein particle complex subunit 4 [Trichoplax sp. H2]|eukprot:XP_002118049.1 hypothetical protein TRIADDRAFT_62101 [Trichoplax adhaerens]